MKTPDEIKKGLECCNTYNGCQSCPYDDEVEKGWVCCVQRNADALAYIQQLEVKVPQWISVKDALPEYGKRVMFITKERRLICVGPYRGAGVHGAQYFLNGNRIETAMWWMPLPPAPEVQG